MRASLLLSSSVLALLTAAACSCSPVARAFDDEDAGVTTDMPEQTSTPKPTDDGGPVSTGGDAGLTPDGASSCTTTPPSNKCGLVAQCGCTLAETCDVTDNAGNVSCVTAGLAAMGVPCVNTSGCARGLTCAGGTCHAFCDNPGSACTVAKTGNCLQLQDSTNKDVPNLAICQVACDLRDAAACGGVSAAGVGVCFDDGKGGTDCGVGGPAALNATCSDTVNCGPALVCVNTTSGSTTTSSCKKWCKVGSTDCGGTVMCTGFSTKVMVGTSEFGVCP